MDASAVAGLRSGKSCEEEGKQQLNGEHYDKTCKDVLRMDAGQLKEEQSSNYALATLLMISED